MAKVNNEKITKRILEETKSNIAEGIPQQLSNVISPVIVSNELPEIKIATGSAIDAASGTIFTTSSTKRTFIVGVLLGLSKSAASTSLYSSIKAYLKTIPGTQSNLLFIPYEPSTAGQFFNSIMFSNPIEILKGTAVTTTNQAAVASIDNYAVIYYYEVDSIDRK